MTTAIRTRYILMNGLDKCPNRQEMRDMSMAHIEPVFDGHTIPCNLCKDLVWGITLTRGSFSGNVYVCKFAYDYQKNRYGDNIPPGIAFSESAVTDVVQHEQVKDRGLVTSEQQRELADTRNSFQTETDNLSGGLTCSICMSTVLLSAGSSDGPGGLIDKIAITPCCHYFHHSCIVRWLQDARTNENKKCPVCRADSLNDPDQFVQIEVKKASADLVGAVNRCFEKKYKTKVQK